VGIIACKQLLFQRLTLQAHSNLRVVISQQKLLDKFWELKRGEISLTELSFSLAVET
jgi:hypothetical protein